MAGCQGSLVDINILIKRLGRLNRFIERNEVTNYKALGAAIEVDVLALSTLLNASSSNQDLSESPTLKLADDVYDTASL